MVDGKMTNSGAFKKGLFLLAVFWLAWVPSLALSQDEGLEITGLVFDETKTKGGHDFYDFFNVNWQPVVGLSYTVLITEQPTRGRGSSIKVSIDQTPVFFESLNPRTDAIEDASKRAVKATQIYLLRQLFTKQELEDEAP